MAGERVYVDGAGGRSVYLQHLSKIIVRPGQKVKAGQVIGYSGSANGVAHLHMATNW
jgi:murein DD-endopeptidase MepM/ murein hydrolase activator NlpD